MYQDLWVNTTLVDHEHLHKTAEVVQLVNEVEKLTDVIGDAGAVWIMSLQVLLKDFTDACKRTSTGKCYNSWLCLANKFWKWNVDRSDPIN